jgi:hypothetical protein
MSAWSPPAWRAEFPVGFFASRGSPAERIDRVAPGAATITVEVRGSVAQQGIVVIAMGSTLIDAIIAAGGTYGGGIMGGVYHFGVTTAGGFRIYDAKDGANRLRSIILHQGDQIFAAE